MNIIAKITAVAASAAAGALLLVNASAYASVILVANLTTSQEPVALPATGNPPTNSSTGLPRPLPFGTATFTLNDAQTALSFFATIFNLDFTGSQTPADTNDNLLNAHIHAGAANAATFPVVWGFLGNPFNDNNPATPGGLIGDCTAFSVGVGGTCAGTWDSPEGNNTTLAAQLPNILAGRSYINFHTVQNTGGEIRGQILVPEPGTLSLLIASLFGFLGFRATRKA